MRMQSTVAMAAYANDRSSSGRKRSTASPKFDQCQANT